jgi:hypothetical protein
VRFQPSEIMKIAVPLACAWFLHTRPLPPSFTTLLVLAAAILVPVLLIAEQPDLGTSLLVAAGGVLVVLLAGLQLRYILGLGAAVGAAIPVVWANLHDYQRQRVCTLLDPTKDPLGAGFHIIQGMIAIGSGGLFGKGFMAGSQAHLNFLPEKQTDFIFTMLAEEFGMVGALALIFFSQGVDGEDNGHVDDVIKMTFDAFELALNILAQGRGDFQMMSADLQIHTECSLVWRCCRFFCEPSGWGSKGVPQRLKTREATGTCAG